MGSVVLSFESGVAVVDAVWESGATAVIAYDDITAMGLLTGLTDRGVDMPGKISIVGCDDMLPVMSRPALNAEPCRQAGRVAMSLLLDAEAEDSARETAQTVTLAGSLVCRDAAGPAPRR